MASNDIICNPSFVNVSIHGAYVISLYDKDTPTCSSNKNHVVNNGMQFSRRSHHCPQALHKQVWGASNP